MRQFRSGETIPNPSASIYLYLNTEVRHIFMLYQESIISPDMHFCQNTYLKTVIQVFFKTGWLYTLTIYIIWTVVATTTYSTCEESRHWTDCPWCSTRNADTHSTRLSYKNSKRFIFDYSYCKAIYTSPPDAVPLYETNPVSTSLRKSTATHDVASAFFARLG